ncbi:MAG: fibrobacter succinogenes major paralogous domain-containing protein [Bacteroidales bacterium]|nr:fibrobacter succinogenes major paralogous domain-containing protein [Bacteroidales bacterium]
MKKAILTLIVLLAVLSGIAQTSSITNIQVNQRSDGSGLVDVNFTLNGTGSSYYINLEASLNAGATYTPIPVGYLSGDVGPITPGSNKLIIWDGKASYPDTYSTLAKIKIIATSSGSGVSCVGAPTVTDIDGNVYNTVQIGTQCWLKQNLKTTRYRNGANIVFPGSDNTAWQNNTTGAYAWYNNDIQWKNIYGGLYNWYALTNTNGLCPTGWHVPSDAEWTQLTNFTSGGANTGGNQLKSCRQVNSPIGGICATDEHPRWEHHSAAIYGTDDYGFSAYPGSCHKCGDGYNLPQPIGQGGYWWTSTTYANITSRAWIRYILKSGGGIASMYWNKDQGYSIRCVRD